MSAARNRTLVTALVLAASVLAACSSAADRLPGVTTTTTVATSPTATTASAPNSATSRSSSENTQPTFATPDPSLAAGSGAGRTIVFVPGLIGVPFYSSVACGATAEAIRLGAVFSTRGDPTFGVDTQTAIVNAVIAEKPNAIMISITDPDAMIQPLQAAKNSGITIIGVDGDLTDQSVLSTNIQSDNLSGGAMAADALATAMGGSGEVVIIDNAERSPISAARVKGFQDQLAARYPNITNLGVQYSGQAEYQAASIAATAAGSNPNLKGIFTVETINTQGAITGIAQAGKTGTVKLVGYDTSPRIVQGLRDRTVDGVILQYPYGEGVLGVQSAIKLLNGAPVDREQTTPSLLATPENLDSAEVQSYLYKVDC